MTGLPRLDDSGFRLPTRLSRLSRDGRCASRDSWLGVSVTEKCKGVPPRADLQLLALPDDFEHDNILQSTTALATTGLSLNSWPGVYGTPCQHYPGQPLGHTHAGQRIVCYKYIELIHQSQLERWYVPPMPACCDLKHVQATLRSQQKNPG